MKNPNGRNLRGWLVFAVSLALIFGTICIAWGGQRSTVASNKARIQAVEQSQKKILDSLARIETKLEVTHNPKPEPKEKVPWNER